MEKDPKQNPKFVERVRENTKRFVHAISEENATLRQKIEVLESGKQVLESWVRNLESTLESEREERENLLSRIDSLERLRASAAAEYDSVEQENNHLAHLYTATFSLHGTLDRDQVLGVIQEIVINLIGSEKFAIVEVDADGRLQLASSVGIDPDEFSSETLENGLIGRTVKSGLLYLGDQEDASSPAREGDLSTCMPLKLEGRVTGAIAIFELLEQKNRLEPLDLELLELLGSQAAIALHCANLHALHG